MTLPSWLLTFRLLPCDTQVSKHTSVLMLPAFPPYAWHVREPPTMIFASAGDVSGNNWELPWPGCPTSRTSTLLTQWRLHAVAFYDRPAHRMCLCRVALSCSHCDNDVVNQTLQVRRIRHRRAVVISYPMLQITADVPVSDISLTLKINPVFIVIQGKMQFRLTNSQQYSVVWFVGLGLGLPLIVTRFSATEHQH